MLLVQAALTHCVQEMTNSAVKITARAWCKNSDYWTVKFDIGDKVKASFAQNGISIPYPQMDVHIKDNK